MEKFAPLEKDAYECVSDEDREFRSTDEEEEEKDVPSSSGLRRITPSLKAATAEFDAEMDNALMSVFLRSDELNQPSSSTQEVVKRSVAESRPDDTDLPDPVLGLREDFSQSDEEFLEEHGMTRETADSLLYNPNDDDDNQNWIDTHRRTYRPRQVSSGPLPKSDAILNCPSCMTLLCLDCQRHVKYTSQYRAMFVENCEIKFDESLTIPMEKRRKRANAVDQNATSLDGGGQISRDRFHPVVCRLCGTEVAVYDCEEVYHFFNVLASCS